MGSNDVPPFIRIPALSPAGVSGGLLAQHLLNFLPLPQEQGSFLPIFIFLSAEQPSATAAGRQGSTKPMSNKFPQAVEYRGARGCWLQGAASRSCSFSSHAKSIPPAP